MRLQRALVRNLVASIAAAVLVAASPALAAAQTGLPAEVASAGVTIAGWDAIRAEARRQARRARVSEQALLAAAGATGIRLAASQRFDPLALQQALIDALQDQADQIAVLQERLDRLTADTDSEIAVLFSQARLALNAGRLREADRLLAEVSSRDLADLQHVDAEVERLRLRAAETIALRGYVGSLEGDYLRAASEFERARSTAPETAIDARWLYSTWQADVLRTYGERFVDDDRLQQAIQIYRSVTIPLATRSSQAGHEAMTLNNVGTVLVIIAQRSRPTELRAALQAFDDALSRTSQQSDPVGWSQTQLNRGTALSALADLGEPGALDEAIRAYRDGLRAINAQTSPHLWGQLNMNLGVAYQKLSETDGIAALNLSAEAFLRALDVWTENGAAREWARVNVNLGVTRTEQFLRGDERAISLAINAFENAQRVLTRDFDPESWAALQGNLGNLHKHMGERGDQAAFARAETAYLAALSVLTVQNDPSGWARTQYNLGQLLRLMGATVARGDRDVALRSVEALENAASVRIRERGIRDYVATQLELGKCLGLLALTGDEPALARSILALNRALGSARQWEDEVIWAEIQMELGLSYFVMSDFDVYYGRAPRVSLLTSRDHFREAARILTEASFPREASYIARLLTMIETRLQSAR